jgi:glycosyltransferase involved in cell wall biosynthesis
VNAVPRVAFFADSFHEVNGVAHTSRQLEAFARRQDYPFFSVHAGPETACFDLGSVRRFEMHRGPAQLGLDRDLSFDLWLWTRRSGITQKLKEFGADVVHITGPSDIGIVGLILAKQLRLPLVASWHTNLHDYAGRRLEHLLPFLPRTWRRHAGSLAEAGSLKAVLRFYKAADALLAPNEELIELIEHGTGKNCDLMQRGIDTDLFSPSRRDRTDRRFTVGYVGRLTAEKNVRFLADVARGLQQAGCRDFRMLIVGQGAEAEWLQANVPQAELTGVLKGEALARAYANMDVFAFPSTTDTFGNVVLEAMASGTPAVVTTGGGPKFLVRDGETGSVCGTDEAFAEAVVRLWSEPERLAAQGRQARESAQLMSWDAVFGKVYTVYREAMERSPRLYRRPLGAYSS